MSEAAVAAEPVRAEALWASRGAVFGAAASLLLSIPDHPWLSPAPPIWTGIALCLLLIAEGVRWRWGRLSQSLVGAGGAALVALGLFLAMTGPIPEAGYPLLLTTAAYIFLRLGVDAGLLVTAVGVAAGLLLGGSGLGLSAMVGLGFVFFSRSVPSRWQILGLIGIGAAFAALSHFPASFSNLAEVLPWVLPLVIAPWLLHFGSPRPWRWTWVASVLALRVLWLGTQAKTSWPAGVALAGAAGLLCLAVPLARQLARDPGSTAARMALEPLLGAAVVAIAFAVPLGMEPYRPWIGAALATPLLLWVDRRLKAGWLWLPMVGAAIAAVGFFFKGVP